MKLTIKKKLISSFLLVTLIFSLASFFSYKNAKEMNESYDYLLGTVAELRSIAEEIHTYTALQIGYYRAYMLYEEEEYRDKLNEANAVIDALVEKGNEIATLQETRDRLNAIGGLNEEFRETTNRTIDTAGIDKEQSVAQGLKEIVPISKELTENTESMSSWLKNDIMIPRVEETKEHSADVLTQVMILSIIASLIAIANGFISSHLISTPIIKLNEVTKKVAAGQLNVEMVRIKGKDELYDLNESFKQMTEHLREMIGGIAANSDQVAASAEQLNASAGQSNRAAETVAAAIQEIAGGAEATTLRLDENSKSLKEVLEGIVQISQSSDQVARLSNETTVEAEEGGRFVEKNLEQMRFIHESVSRSNEVISNLSERSKEIGYILDVISNIAAQTNLLALNAAIEAARAGEHGKGFAVVADEVRKLAEQSQQSAQSIADLVNIVQKDTEESVAIMNEVMENAKQGVEISEATSNKFVQILGSTRKIAPQIEDVTATVQQMSASLQVVSQSASEISGLAEMNASSSEEVAASTEEQLASMEEIEASAQSLATMAEELKALVNKFKI